MGGNSLTWDWPIRALEVLRDASGHTDDDTQIIMDGIRERGFVVVPVREIPDEAVGEVMAWTGCDCPNMAWEGLNCALNMLGIDWPDDPTAMEHIRKLGAGESTLEQFRAYKRSTGA